MKIIVVCRFHGVRIVPFISEQAEAVERLGHEVRFVISHHKGVRGYIELYRNLRKAMREMQPDIIHAHFGICGFAANLQRKVPVVVTYLGSDINTKIRYISILSMLLSKYNIFMGTRQLAKVKRFANPAKTEIVRYGILSDLFVEQDKQKAREALGLDKDKKYVLFSGRFSRLDKDPELAKAAVALLNDGENEVVLQELTGGYTKEEMVSLMNAVDAAVVTSKAEGSPQFTKEVMSCGCPIVSVDVGDVAEQVEGLDGCYIVKSRDPREIADALKKAIAFGKTNGHQHIKDMQLDNDQVAKKIVEIYEKLLGKERKS